MNIDELKLKLYKSLPVDSVYIIEFLKLLNIRYDDKEVESACVTCAHRPELILNKDFVETYCKTNEHLLMLIMHELYHIILGHTKLYKVHNYIDNIAFDAIINAILCRNFSDECYTSFFTNLYDDSKFPECLLRPSGKNTPKEYLDILDNLYNSTTGTYYEIYQILLLKLKDKLNHSCLLLGSHGSNNTNSSPLMKSLISEIISKWPKAKITKGRDFGGELIFKNFERENKNNLITRKIKKLLLKSGFYSNVNLTNKRSVQNIKVESILSIPNLKDRTILTKKITYGTPVLYRNDLTSNVLNRESLIKTNVYLDVSGSVLNSIKKVLPNLLPFYLNKELNLFVFSTVVKDTTYKDYKNGNFYSTGGTDINCIFDHYFSNKKINKSKKILIFTDGDTGVINETNLEKIKKSKLKIYIGLFGNYTTRYLEKDATYMEVFDE